MVSHRAHRGLRDKLIIIYSLRSLREIVPPIRVVLAACLVIGLSQGLSANRVEAGGISIRSRMTLSVLSDRITVKLEASNTGDEAGKKIRAVLHIFDYILKSKTFDRLDAGKSHTFFFDVTVPEDRHGQFAFIGEVVFHDDNLHPFSAISAGTFLLRNKYPSLIHGRCSDISFEKKGRFTVYVKNTSPRPQTMKATLYLPYALMALEKEKRFRIKANDETPVNFELKYRYNIGSAVYPFFCVLEYEEKENHHASLVQATARIVEPKNWFTKTRWYWLAGLGGIGVAWTVFFVLLSIKRQRA